MSKKDTGAERNKAKNSGKSMSLRAKVGGVFGVLLFAVLILFAAPVAALYYLNWDNAYTQLIADAVKLPAASIEGDAIEVSKFKKAFASLKKYQTFEASIQQGEGVEQPSPDELEENLLNRMIDDVVINQLLEQYGSSVTEEEVDQELKRLDEILGEDVTVADHVREVYDWSVDEFKEFALKPGLQEFKLQQLYFSNETIGGSERQAERDAKLKAEKLADEIRNGADFSEKATEISDDAFSAEKGGELGLISRGEMVPEFDSAAFELEQGVVSDPVKSQFGYHILRVDGIEGEGEEERRNVRHILIMTENSFTQWFFAEKMARSVSIFDQRFSWNAAEGLAERS